MEDFFKLREHGTNVKTEVVAGITTFLSMVYILAVNPSILSATEWIPEPSSQLHALHRLQVL